MSLHTCLLTGYIGNDVELKQTETTGMSVVNFRLATNTVWRDDQALVTTLRVAPHSLFGIVNLAVALALPFDEA